MANPNGTSSIAIAGAGIAGLTAALALARAGFGVAVFEKSERLPHTGTGIQLSPNACKVLDGLGLRRAVTTAGFAPDGVEIRSGLNGRKLSFFDLGRTATARHGAPYLVLHRADLAALLRDACAQLDAIALHFGQAVQSIEQDGQTVRFTTLGNGKTSHHTAALLIGADGVGSTVRQHVGGAAKPEFTGHVAWRGVVEMASVPPGLSRTATGLWLGPRAHLVHYPVQSGARMNLVAITPWNGPAPPGPGWLEAPQDEQRLEAFAGWTARIRTLVGSAANWGGWPVNAVARAQNWSQGRLALIGDAAHAMVPFAAQGGAAAIEDAVVLAELCSARRDNLREALAGLSPARSARINGIISLSNNNRHLYHLAGPAAWARNLAMPLAPQAVLQRRMDWLYGWEAAPSA